MTLRNLLFGVLGTLGLLLAVVAGLSANDAWRDRATANAVSDSNADTDLLLVASRYLIEERDSAYVALVSPGAALGAKTGLAATRKKADAALAEAEQRIAGRSDDQRTVGPMRAVSQAGATVAELRRRVDSVLSQRNEDGDPALAREWWASMGELIAASEELRVAAASRANVADAATGGYSSLKHFAEVIADYTGRERAQLAEIIHQDMPLPPLTLRRLSDYRGRVELAWSALQEEAGSADVDPAVTAAIRAAEAELFGVFERTRDPVYRAGITADIYPVPVAQWFAASTAAIATIHTVQDALVAANERHTAAAAASATSYLNFLALLLAFGAVAIVVSFFVVARRVVGPLKAMTTAMTGLAEGDMTVEIPAAGRKDEIGQMAEAVQVFKDNAIEKLRLEEEQAAAASRVEEEKRQGMNELADRFEKQVKEVVDGVSSQATEMQATAQQMSATAEETSRQSANVASASDQATANVQTVAATTEEMSASIAEIGRQVMQSTKIAANAVSEADATNETVQGLAEAAGKIGEVVSLINDIAGQTNLLALNATIEAARAGEAGKGFAVVAQEVKNLASQTAKATEDISTQIGAVQQETEGAVGAIERIRGIIGEISDISTTIASAVEEQGVSTQEIARNVQQAAKGTQDVNTNIESVNKAAGETGTAAGQVLNAAEEMSRQAEGLRSEVDKFLAEVRSA